MFYSYYLKGYKYKYETIKLYWVLQFYVSLKIIISLFLQNESKLTFHLKLYKMSNP